MTNRAKPGAVRNWGGNVQSVDAASISASFSNSASNARLDSDFFLDLDFRFRTGGNDSVSPAFFAGIKSPTCGALGRANGFFPSPTEGKGMHFTGDNTSSTRITKVSVPA